MALREKLSWAALFLLMGFIVGAGLVDLLASRAIKNVIRTATEERERLTVEIKQLRRGAEWPFDDPVKSARQYFREGECYFGDVLVICTKMFKCPPDAACTELVLPPSTEHSEKERFANPMAYPEKPIWIYHNTFHASDGAVQ